MERAYIDSVCCPIHFMLYIIKYDYIKKIDGSHTSLYLCHTKAQALDVLNIFEKKILPVN